MKLALGSLGRALWHKIRSHTCLILVHSFHISGQKDSIQIDDYDHDFLDVSLFNFYMKMMFLEEKEMFSKLSLIFIES